MAKNWYVLRVQSNKEHAVRDALERKAKLEAVEDRLSRVVVPTERVSTMKGGKRRVSERKLYPGYVFVEMELDESGRVPEKVWFLVRETNGVGDFIGTEGKPSPMSAGEVDKLLGEADRGEEEAPALKVDYSPGDQVKVKQGPFENSEGVVDEVDLEKGLVRVILTIFGRPTPVELEYWQVGPI